MNDVNFEIDMSMLLDWLRAVWPYTDVVVHKVRERVRAYPTLITAGKGASHPQLPSNTPGYGRVNGMNGPDVVL